MSNAYTGTRKEGFNVVHVAGAIGAVAGAAANYGEGCSLTSCIAGGLVGGAVGVAAANVIGADYYESASAKIIGSMLTGSIGLSIGAMTTGLMESIGKINGSGSAE